jgi:hypothetical protein
MTTTAFERSLAVLTICDMAISSDALNGYIPSTGAPSETALTAIAASKQALADGLASLGSPPPAARALRDMISVARQMANENARDATLEHSGQMSAANAAWQAAGSDSLNPKEFDDSTRFFREFAALGINYSDKSVIQTLHVSDFPSRCRAAVATSLQGVIAPSAAVQNPASESTTPGGG